MRKETQEYAEEFQDLTRAEQNERIYDQMIEVMDVMAEGMNELRYLYISLLLTDQMTETYHNADENFGTAFKQLLHQFGWFGNLEGCVLVPESEDTNRLIN